VELSWFIANAFDKVMRKYGANRTAKANAFEAIR
jgi:hypothetical protein